MSTNWFIPFLSRAEISLFWFFYRHRESVLKVAVSGLNSHVIYGLEQISGQRLGVKLFACSRLLSSSHQAQLARGISSNILQPAHEVHGSETVHCCMFGDKQPPFICIKRGDGFKSNIISQPECNARIWKEPGAQTSTTTVLGFVDNFFIFESLISQAAVETCRWQLHPLRYWLRQWFTLHCLLQRQLTLYFISKLMPRTIRSHCTMLPRPNPPVARATTDATATTAR